MKYLNYVLFFIFIYGIVFLIITAYIAFNERTIHIGFSFGLSFLVSLIIYLVLLPLED